MGAEVKWQLIENAPLIEVHEEPLDALVYGPVGMFMGRVARYKDGHLFAGVAHVGGNLANDGVTHWMVKPEPPKKVGPSWVRLASHGDWNVGDRCRLIVPIRNEFGKINGYRYESAAVVGLARTRIVIQMTAQVGRNGSVRSVVADSIDRVEP